MPKLRAGGGDFTTPSHIRDAEVISLPGWQTCWQTSLMICKSLPDKHLGKFTTPKSANSHGYDLFAAVTTLWAPREPGGETT